MPLLNEKTVKDILMAQHHQQQQVLVASNGLPDLANHHGDDGVANQKMLDIEKNGTGAKFTPPKVDRQISMADRISAIPAFGLLMALISVVCFSIGSVIVKVLTQMHTIQVLVIRCAIQFIFYTITALIYRYPLLAPRGHRLDLCLRCVSGTISLITIFLAYRLMPLADASTIHFASPVFVTIFAYFILKEPLTILQVLTGTITLTGVVIIAKPEFLFGAETEPSVHENRLLGTILACVAAVTASLSMITLRRLKSTPVAVVVMWYSGTVVVAGLVILLALQQLVLPTGLWTWTLLVGIGMCGIGDQYFLTMAFKYESAGPVSVTRTFNIVLSFIWEVTLLSESIEWTSLLGAALVSSCVVLLAMDKWRQESPELFGRLGRRLRCWSTVSDGKAGDDTDGNGGKKPQLPDSLRGSTDSLDSIVIQSTVHSNAILLGRSSSDDDEDHLPMRTA